MLLMVYSTLEISHISLLTQSNNSVGPNTKPPVERDSRLAEKIARKLKLQLVDRRLRLVLIGWNPRKYEKKLKKQTDREEQDSAARKIQAIVLCLHPLLGQAIIVIHRFDAL